MNTQTFALFLGTEDFAPGPDKAFLFPMAMRQKSYDRKGKANCSQDVS